jgi:hypothetical protein
MKAEVVTVLSTVMKAEVGRECYQVLCIIGKL